LPPWSASGYDACMQRWILHVDMDAFFAAVERLDDPSLVGRPIIVGGLGPRGVVSTASYEARAYGVRSAQPMAQARRLCPQGVFLAPRHERYERVSQSVREVLARYAQLVEPVSVDEAFVDLTGVEQPPERVATSIHQAVPRETGLSCSAGLAVNRLLAKLASEAAKPGGFRVIHAEEVGGFLDPLPVERLWSVGPKTAQRLSDRGVRTVGDLRGVDPSLLHAWFGAAHGATLWRYARGLDDSPVVPVREAKSISQEITFPEDVHEHAFVIDELRRMATGLARRLADEGLLARAVRLKVRWSDFATQTRQVKLPEPTDDPSLIADEAVALWACRLPEGGHGVRLLGVGLDGLIEASFRPLALFRGQGAPAAP